MDAQRRVKSRGDRFAERTSTSIWMEVPTRDNPYIPERSLCRGYDLLELVKSRSFLDVLYLLLKGDLPTHEQRELLEKLMIGLCNPGPRHPATRAAMNAAVSKAHPEELLPVGLLALSGSYLGAAEVEGAMRFIRKSWRRGAGDVVERLLADRPDSGDGDLHVAPGFGSCFGDIDRVTTKLADAVSGLSGASRALAWGMDLSSALRPYRMGWLPTGLAAAAFLDLGIHPRVGPGLFQLVSAPGLLAHSVEMAAKPMTAMPFLPNECYIDETDPSRD